MKRIKATDIFIILLAAATLAAATLPFPALKQAGDWFVQDGNFERLSEDNVIFFRLFFAFSSVFFTGFVIWGICNGKGREKFLKSALHFPCRCAKDFVVFRKKFVDLIRKSPDWSLIAIGFILFGGALLRFLLLDRPLLHDEAYTMYTWGRSDLFYVVSDYHLPNNHILNSILVNLIYHLGARSAWLLRLPVFVSGILLIFFVWVLGKAMYNDLAGTIAAVFTAFYPFLVDYSVNARGYEIQALLTVLSVGLALYAKRKDNMFAWFLLSVVSALNFFTIPTALYPFGGICLWLVIEGLFSDRKTKRKLLRNTVILGFSVCILTVLLYVHVLLDSGTNSLAGNVFVRPLDWKIFLPTLYTRIKESADIFFGSIPRFTSVIILIGFLWAPSALKNLSKERVSPLAAMLLFLLPAVFIHRPNLWPRTLLYLHPLLILSAASGLAWLADTGTFRFFCIGVVFCSAVAAAIPQFYPAFQNFGSAGPVEKAVWKVIAKEGLDAENVYIATVSEDNAPFWMYADFYGLPSKMFDRSKPFDTVYVFANPSNDTENGASTLEEVLAEEGPGDQFIDFDSMRTLSFSQDGILYRADALKDVVKREYGTK